MHKNKIFKRLTSWVLNVVMVMSLLVVLPDNLSPVKTMTAEAAGIDNITARADYLYNLTWTSQVNFNGYINSKGTLTKTYQKGGTYKIPYGMPVNGGKFIGYGISPEAFIEATHSADNPFYSKRATYNTTNSNYYSMDCSTFVSWCWNLLNRQTCTSLMNIGIENLGYCNNTNVSKIQQGDAINCPGDHVVLVSRVYSNGTYEITEETPPEIKRSVYSKNELVKKYSSYKICRYKYRGDVTPPPDHIPPKAVNISTDKTTYKVGETINFSFTYSNASKVYVHIDANGKRVDPWADVTGKATYSCSFNQPGYYVYRLYATNSIGEAATEWYVFTIYDNEPSSMSIKCDKPCYAVGETINFDFSVNDASEAYVHIDANGVRVEPWANVTGKTTYSCSFNQPGYYVYRLYAINPIGESATEWQVFTIYDNEPSSMSIKCDKSCYAVGETINFDFSVKDASEAYVHIDANGVRVEPWANVTGKTTYSCSFNQPGYYVYRLYAVNKYGTPATEWQVFYVYDSKPSDFEITTDKVAYKYGEQVEFTFKSKNSAEQYIPIDVNGVRKHFIDVSNQTNYICSFDTIGSYSYCLYGRNNIGEGGCEYKTFTIYNDGDLNLDGEFNVSDVVLLQKWLLAVPDTHLACWQAADICEDEKLDVFDLCMMKRMLVENR